MHIFADAAIIATIINIINTVANIYWSTKLKSIQANGEISKALKESNQEKDEVIKDLQRKKNQYKTQYDSLLVKYSKLEGEMSACRRLHT